MTKIFGILNITPDSFSDGGKYFNQENAVKYFEKMIAEGADVIDVGAQSTRPNADIIPQKEEWQRLENFFRIISKKKYDVEISLDSCNPETVEKALGFNIDYINDVSGFKDDRMKKLAANSGKKIIFMHSLTIPADKKIYISENEDVIDILSKWLEKKILELSQSSIKKENMIFDPGIGFGKTARQSLEIIMNIERFKKFGIKILVGHSEKSFLSLFTDKPAGQRGEETRRFTKILAEKSVDYIRVHNVLENKKVINAV